jgi:hypothetical protein
MIVYIVEYTDWYNKYWYSVYAKKEDAIKEIQRSEKEYNEWDITYWVMVEKEVL